MPDDHSKVLTLVFTDLADSTALKTAQGDEAVDGLLTRHREHVSRLAEECAGRVIDWAGDGCFLTFETSSAGVMFALRLQQVHSEESDLPGVRIGIHMGEVTERPGPDGSTHVKGLAVDIAARIAGLAKPGQVLMSSSVYDSARQRLGVDAIGQPILWQLHGAYELKGFDHSVEIGEAGFEGRAPLLAPKTGDKARLVKRARRRRAGPYSGNRRYPLVPALAVAALILLTAAVVYVLTTRGHTAGPGSAGGSVSIGPITSLAVLPLDNISGDPEQEIFSDGMTEAIIAELAKIEALKVISRTSVMRYKDTDLSMPEIATELGVQGIIEGSVLREDDDVRITVQLIDGRTDAHVWSDSYTETITSVLQIQSDIALAISNAVGAELSGDERSRISEARTVDQDAFESFLVGDHFLSKHATYEDLEAAIEYLGQATQIDPTYAKAWARLGDAYSQMTLDGHVSPSEVIPRAREAYVRALEIDAGSPEAQRGLAFIAFAHDRQYDQALNRLNRALDMSPSLQAIHSTLMSCHLFIGHWEKALRHAKIVLDLDPQNPDVLAEVSMVFGIMGNFQEAEDLLNKALAIDPDHRRATEERLWQSFRMGDYSRAIDQATQWVELTDRSSQALADNVDAYAFAGQLGRARDLLQELLERREHISHSDLAWAYVKLRDFDSAFDEFRRGIEANESWMVFLRLNPYSAAYTRMDGIDEFIADPRYWELIERMDFPPLPPEHPGYEDEQAWLARKAEMEAANAPIEKIAVLPFVFRGSDKGEEWFADGMTEMLVAQLVKSGVRVLSRTSAMHFKDTDEGIPDIARALGVDALVQGSVQRAGDNVLIVAQLIPGVTDEPVWAENYDGTLENILSLQSEVALDIAEQIQVVIAPADALRMRSQRKVVPAAQDAYLRGQFLVDKKTKDESDAGIMLMESATTLAPDYAEAWASLASNYADRVVRGFASADREYPLAREAAKRALEIDDSLAEAHATLGWVEWAIDWNWEAMERECRTAIDLDPDSPLAREYYAWYLMYSGRLDEAEEQARFALERDPLALAAHEIFGATLNWSRQFSQSIEAMDRALQLEPNHVPFLMANGIAHLNLRHTGEAIEWFEKALEVSDRAPLSLAQAGAAYAKIGDDETAKDLFAELEQNHSGNSVFCWGSALIYSQLGMLDEAFAMLDRGFDKRDWLVTGLATNPMWDPLKGDARYDELVRRLGIPEPGNVN